MCVFEQRSHVIVAVEAGLAGPGLNGGGYLIIIVFAWGMQPPTVDVDRGTSWSLNLTKKSL